MKRQLLIILPLLILFSSCSTDEAETEDLGIDNFPQEWVLFKSTTSMQGEVFTGEELEWQETYIFNKDHSFTKTRTTDGGKVSASGSFEVQQEENITKFILTFKENSPIIGTCSQENIEFLTLDPENGVLFSNWWACDGPGLFYEKVK